MRERHTRHQAGHVDFGDGSHFPEVAFALAVLALGQVATTLLATQDFARTGDFETLGDAFPSFASSNIFSHRRRAKWQSSEGRQVVF